ncbi:MAG: hypothetical protein HY403_05440 [Elusimicrobia bacterium]|nr:hypothetical protein [Elusimicrobiota bacterium]
MSMLRVDWNPSPAKLREFGGGLIVFGLLLGGLALSRGRPHGLWLVAAGLALGLIVLAAPAAGRLIYKAWMGVAFVIGGAVSLLILGGLYYGLLTPLALFFRVRGRDALRLKKPALPTYWLPLETPRDKKSYERLF